MGEAGPEEAATSEPGTLSVSRFEAFSDGVFAIAITLLVLDIRVDEGDGDLLHRVFAAWPHVLGFALSFLVIGAMWINHHYLCSHASRIGRGSLLANLALLALISLLPFPTSLLAEYVTGPTPDATTAAALYALTCLLIGGAFFMLTHELSRDSADPARAALYVRFQRRALVSPAGYVLAFALAFVAPKASLALFVLLATFFVLHRPPARG